MVQVQITGSPPKRTDILPGVGDWSKAFLETTIAQLKMGINKLIRKKKKKKS